jgi:diacylglycerol kinase (ATP)
MEVACREVVIAVNPKAGSSGSQGAVGLLTESLLRYGMRPITLTNIDEIVARVSAQSDNPHQGIRCTVAVGGDGTVGLLANRLPAGTRLAIFPQGTENLLAKHLGIAPDPGHVARMIAEGCVLHLDAGMANGKLFLIMASCGFDAEVVHQVHKMRRGHIRHWTYARPIVNAIRKYRYPVLNIYCDGEGEPMRARWAFLFNVPRYAMNLPIASQADPEDGLLDFCGFRGGNLFNGLMYLAGVLLRQHGKYRDTTVRRGTRFVITSEEKVPYQLDGDPGGELPLEITVLPGRVPLIVPAVWSKRDHPDKSRIEVLQQVPVT